MSWYRDGTISVASGSKAVTGTNTTFNDTAAGVNPGDMIIVGGQFLEVATVNSATSITTVNAATAAVSGATYQIVTTVQMSNASLAKKISAAMDRILLGISNWMLIFKGSGNITITNYDGSTSTGLAWPSLTDIAQRSLVVNDSQLTTVNPIMDSNVYTVNAGAAGLPSSVTVGGLLENIKYGTTGVSQTFRTASLTSGQLNREFQRYGSISGSTITWTTWTELFNTNTIVGVSNGGTGATTAAGARTALGFVGDVLPLTLGGTGSAAPFGTAANTFAQGNDSRLNTVNNKSGGTISSSVTISAGPLVCNTSNIVSRNNRNGSSGATTQAGWFQSMFNGTNAQFSSFMEEQVGINLYGVLTLGDGSIFRRWHFAIDGSAYATNGNWVNGSDIRLKEDIQPVDNALASVLGWQGSSWKWRDSSRTKRGLGLIADSVEKVFPDAISTFSTVIDGKPVNDVKAIDPGSIAAAYHTESIKTLFSLLELALSNPEEAKMQMEAIRTAMDVGEQ